MTEEADYFHIEGTDQAYITQKASDLLISKLIHFRFSIVGIHIHGIDIKDIFGHAFHCHNKDGNELIIFNFTCHLNIIIYMNTETYNGIMELKNIKSEDSSEVIISIDHWKNAISPKKIDYNQCIAALTSCKIKNMFKNIIKEFRQDLAKFI